MKYKAIIIGAGNQGILNDLPCTKNQHKVISFYKAMVESGNFEVSAIIDTDKNKIINAINYIKKNHNKSVTSSPDIKSLRYTFPAHYFDVIIVSSHDETHYQILLDIIKTGFRPKLVIVEKPVCMNKEDAEKIKFLYELFNIPILVNYTRRFLPEYKQLKAKIYHEKEKLGNLSQINIFYNRGKEHTLTHAIDTINYLFATEDPLCKFLLIESKIKIIDFTEIDYRMWKIEVIWENYYWKEERIFDHPVNPMFDFNMRHVINNAYNFLESKEELLCNIDDAIKALDFEL